jgi:hypothetical protein
MNRRLEYRKLLRFPNLEHTKYEVTSLENPNYYGVAQQILKRPVNPLQ